MNREDNRRRFELLRRKHYGEPVLTGTEEVELLHLQDELADGLGAHYCALILDLDARIAQLEARVEGAVACPA